LLFVEIYLTERVAETDNVVLKCEGSGDSGMTRSKTVQDHLANGEDDEPEKNEDDEDKKQVGSEDLPEMSTTPEESVCGYICHLN